MKAKNIIEHATSEKAYKRYKAVGSKSDKIKRLKKAIERADKNNDMDTAKKLEAELKKLGEATPADYGAQAAGAKFDPAKEGSMAAKEEFPIRSFFYRPVGAPYSPARVEQTIELIKINVEAANKALRKGEELGFATYVKVIDRIFDLAKQQLDK